MLIPSQAIVFPGNGVVVIFLDAVAIYSLTDAPAAVPLVDAGMPLQSAHDDHQGLR